MEIILSIKPEFAEKIFDGTKKFEFRRSLFKQNVNKVKVYASSPVSKVIGEFKIEKVLFQKLSSLWKKTAKHSGISEDCYFSYFLGKESGYAIKVKDPKRYKKHLCIKEHFGLKPPQSFTYIR